MTKRLPRNQILVGDARTVLANLPRAFVDCVVTSPPYFRLRNYQHQNQLGLEDHVDQWVNELLLVMRGVKRVLKPTGSLWLNLGDTYSRAQNEGAVSKSLLLAPERLALAMVADGWILRNKIVWAKPNPMPTSVRDRLACTYEVVYFFSASNSYYFDLDAVRVPHTSRSSTRRQMTSAQQAKPAWSVPPAWRGPAAANNDGLDRLKASGLPGHPLGKNPGDVWTIPTASYAGAHHAVYPERLVERPLLAACPEKVCAGCGTSWMRAPHRQRGHLAEVGQLRKACSCRTDITIPGVVFDPFMGSGTTGVVAERLGRDWVGIEVNPGFAAQAERRIDDARQRKVGVDRRAA